ncbi:MAG TPA: J domain-containing protein, partial [Candidatus Limnocylindria bacterium]|nr:J domain-containing protein [Candidatus Limnocylindria bacterium]
MRQSLRPCEAPGQSDIWRGPGRACRQPGRRLKFEPVRAESAALGDKPVEGTPFVDYYELLQVSPNADDETIHRVFRLLAKKHHP